MRHQTTTLFSGDPQLYVFRTNNKMVNVSRTTIMLGVVISVFLVINIVLGTSIFFASTNLTRCKDFQSNNCPIIMCNGDPTNNDSAPNAENFTTAKDGTNPAFCWPYAYRVIGDPTNPDSYTCNTPYPGRIPINENTTS